jgi:UDP-N-acetylmuramate--alanine ligase
MRRVITYGLAEEGNAGNAGLADVAGHDVRLEAFAAQCTVSHLAGGVRTELGTLRLKVPGRHNLLNALGAVAVGLELQVPFGSIAAALAEFAGAERRFQVRGEQGGVMVVDDYGHHPTEITAVLAAARAGIDRRVIVVFQPHRYTRTSQLMREFGVALSAADEVVLTDIYPAGEAPIPGVTVDALATAIRAAARGGVRVVPRLEDVPAAVALMARPGDLVITLGAGSIGSTGERILDAIRHRRTQPAGSGGAR